MAGKRIVSLSAYRVLIPLRSTSIYPLSNLDTLRIAFTITSSLDSLLEGVNVTTGKIFEYSIEPSIRFLNCGYTLCSNSNVYFPFFE